VGKLWVGCGWDIAVRGICVKVKVGHGTGRVHTKRRKGIKERQRPVPTVRLVYKKQRPKSSGKGNKDNVRIRISRTGKRLFSGNTCA